MDFSNASKFRNARKFSGTKPAKKASSIPYIVIDIETDGLDENNHTILELGAVRIDGERRKEFSCLIYYEKKLPDAIVELTGITESMLRETGVPLDDALEQFEFYR